MRGQEALRRDHRYPVHVRVRITWEDNHGNHFQSHGSTLDISKSGISFEIGDVPPLHSYVLFNIPLLKFSGSGSVRFVKRKGLRQIVGLEFSGGLTWNPERYPLPVAS